MFSINNKNIMHIISTMHKYNIIKFARHRTKINKTETQHSKLKRLATQTPTKTTRRRGRIVFLLLV